jgi:hypothetical protein
MTWEEDMPVGKQDLPFRSQASEDEARRKRSKRIRYFLTVWGAMHWAERVEGRSIDAPRRGHISL